MGKRVYIYNNGLLKGTDWEDGTDQKGLIRFFPSIRCYILSETGEDMTADREDGTDQKGLIRFFPSIRCYILSETGEDMTADRED